MHIVQRIWNFRLALLPYLNKKSKLEISDLKQKSQELATDLNNRFENEKADKLYANIALLLSKNERIKEGLSVIKKIKKLVSRAEIHFLRHFFLEKWKKIWVKSWSQ